MKEQDNPNSGAPQAALSRQGLEQHLRARAWKDDAFRQELLAHPQAVLERDYAVWSPKGGNFSNLSIKVIEEDEQTLCLVLPPKASDALLEMEDLDENELSLVEGAGSTGGTTGCPPCLCNTISTNCHSDCICKNIGSSIEKRIGNIERTISRLR
jgi:hypothetical protein